MLSVFQRKKNAICQVIIWTPEEPISYTSESLVVLFLLLYNCCVYILYGNKMLLNWSVLIIEWKLTDIIAFTILTNNILACSQSVWRYGKHHHHLEILWRIPPSLPQTNWRTWWHMKTTTNGWTTPWTLCAECRDHAIIGYYQEDSHPNISCCHDDSHSNISGCHDNVIPTPDAHTTPTAPWYWDGKLLCRWVPQ